MEVAIKTGAVTVIQRFNSALDVSPHFHVLFLDGVYSFAVADFQRTRCEFFLPASSSLYRLRPSRLAVAYCDAGSGSGACHEGLGIR